MLVSEGARHYWDGGTGPGMEVKPVMRRLIKQNKGLNLNSIWGKDPGVVVLVTDLEKG